MHGIADLLALLNQSGIVICGLEPWKSGKKKEEEEKKTCVMIRRRWWLQRRERTSITTFLRFVEMFASSSLKRTESRFSMDVWCCLTWWILMRAVIVSWILNLWPEKPPSELSTRRPLHWRPPTSKIQLVGQLSLFTQPSGVFVTEEWRAFTRKFQTKKVWYFLSSGHNNPC